MDGTNESRSSKLQTRGRGYDTIGPPLDGNGRKKAISEL